jgi:hypothetical protein
MSKIKQFVIRNSAFLIILLLLVMPVLSFAAGDPPDSGLIPPCSPNCGFNDLLTLVNTVIKFILFDLALPIAAIMFAYAGFLLVSSGGSTEARGKAKEIFTNTLLGLIFAVAAWLIINSILSILGYTGDWIGFVKPTP